MSLAKLQENFANHIYNKNELKILEEIQASDIATDQRLDIYRNNVFSNFDEALALTYKIIKKIVGEDYFSYLTKEYNKKYYSNSGNLEDYGKYFPDMIESFLPNHKLVYLADIAKLEWFYNLAYFSKEAEDIDVQKLQSLNEDEFMKLFFELHSSCFLIKSKYPIYSIRQMNQADQNKKVKFKENDSQFIIIEKSQLRVNLHQLTNIEYEFLELIQKSKNIYEIYEILAAKQENFDVGAFVNKFISLRIITNFRIGNDKIQKILR